jgi:hypothetical protein
MSEAKSGSDRSTDALLRELLSHMSLRSCGLLAEMEIL